MPAGIGLAGAASGRPAPGAAGQAPAQQAPVVAVAAAPAARRKLSFKETRELAALPAAITALESEQRALTARMCQPQYFRTGAERMRGDRARAAEIETQLSARLERWEYLESQAGAGAD